MAGFDIGPIHVDLGGDSSQAADQTPAPQPETIASLLQQGVRVSEVISSADQTKHIDLGYVIQPGDKIFADDGKGTVIGTTVVKNDDGSLGNNGWAPTKPEAKPANPDVRNFGTANNPDWRQYNPDSKKWEPVEGVGGAATATPELHNFGTATHPNWAMGVKDTKTGNWSPAGAAGGADAGLAWVQQQLAAGKGTQGFGTGSQWNDHELGQDIQVGYGTPVPLVQGTVTQVQDWGYGDYAVVIQRPDGSEYTIGHIQKPDYKVGDQVTSQDTVLSGGSESPISSGPQVEVRMKVNGQYVDPAKYVQTLGTSGTPAGSGTLKEPTIHIIGGKPYSWNGSTLTPVAGDFPGTATKGAPVWVTNPDGTKTAYERGSDGTWQKAGLPDQPATLTGGNAPDSMMVLAQQAKTIDYIKQQVAAGTLTLADANAYFGAIKQQAQAAIAGTTPYTVWKDTMDQEKQRADFGRQMLDNQMTDTANLTRDLLTAYDSGKTGLGGSGYNPILDAQAMAGEQSMNLGPQPTSETAKALIDALNPSNPQPTVGSAMNAAFGPNGMHIGPIPGTQDPNEQAGQQPPQQEAA